MFLQGMQIVCLNQEGSRILVHTQSHWSCSLLDNRILAGKEDSYFACHEADKSLANKAAPLMIQAV